MADLSSYSAYVTAARQMHDTIGQYPTWNAYAELHGLAPNRLSKELSDIGKAFTRKLCADLGVQYPPTSAGKKQKRPTHAQAKQADADALVRDETTIVAPPTVAISASSSPPASV